MPIPSAYQPKYDVVRSLNPELADQYLANTVVGDPLADVAVAALAEYPQDSVHDLIVAGVEQDWETLRSGPEELLQFFEQLDTAPSWFQPREVIAGCRAYHANSDMFIAAHATGVLMVGFSTLISKSFFATGRLSGDFSTRRLRQNTRHLLNISLPGGLERHGDGWRLTVRIRLVHAQIRRLLRESGDWDESMYGVPVSAANVAFSCAGFSALLLKMAAALGADMDRAERDSFMHIWRYTSWLMGVPEPLLFQNEAEALELLRIGLACEPFPDEESIAMAHHLIHAAASALADTSSSLFRKSESVDAQDVANDLYRLSRCLIGDELADKLQFPKQWTFGVLAYIRWRRRLEKTFPFIFSGRSQSPLAENFITMLERSEVDPGGIIYRLPDHIHSERSSFW